MSWNALGREMHLAASEVITPTRGDESTSIRPLNSGLRQEEQAFGGAKEMHRVGLRWPPPTSWQPSEWWGP